MAGAPMAERRRILVAGGGAAGFFGAIACAEADPGAEVTLHEATAHPLAKVRISGGGRCNVTHACFEPRELVRSYPRGSRELLGPLHRFGPAETVAWFAQRGVELKTEGDGRMFPVTDSSSTIVECLHGAARRAGVGLRTGSGLGSLERAAGPGGVRFRAALSGGEVVLASKVLLATGGGKGSAGLAAAQALGHTIVPPVPSLFTFHVDDPRLKGLEGVSVPRAGVSAGGIRLRETGALLVTHWGLSGPAILRLSAWGARELHAAGYRFALTVNWAEPRSAEEARRGLGADRASHPKRRVATANPFGIPGRLWERLSAAAGIAPEATWASVSNDALRLLALQVTASEFAVTGKSMNKEEFVTCGGVSLAEVDMATMESRICPGLYFAGEVLDIDGVTGGFNFQAAWTTGWQAGQAMAAV
jgi:predicted Rossmann fold flavoprotein